MRLWSTTQEAVSVHQAMSLNNRLQRTSKDQMPRHMRQHAAAEPGRVRVHA